MNSLALNGGNPACTVSWPSWPQWDDTERTALLSVLESGKWWYGDRVRQFEQEFAAFQSARFGVTTTSGTTALEAALLALGIGAGDEVIVPPYTFLATASAVLRVNAIPVFADVEPDTLCIDPDDVIRKITPATKAIIPVHLGGYVADMDRLVDIAGKHRLFIVEDACHSWGSQWKGKGTGAIGDCGVFSFQASKNISSAEGGIILTDNEDIADRCRSYTNCGRSKHGDWYEHFLLGSNLRLTEFQAALLCCQLARLPRQTEIREHNAALIDAALANIPGIHIMKHDPRITRHGYHFYPFRLDLDLLGISRLQIMNALQAEGVPTMIGYDRPLYANPLFQEQKQTGPASCPVSCPFHANPPDYRSVSCPVCEQAVQDTLWIFHTVLLAPENDIRSLISAFQKVFSHLSELQ